MQLDLFAPALKDGCALSYWFPVDLLPTFCFNLVIFTCLSLTQGQIRCSTNVYSGESDTECPGLWALDV